MKNNYRLLLGLLIFVILIIGSASMLGAAPIKEPIVEVKITKVVDQTIYYSVKWANLITPVQSYTLGFSYEYYPGGYMTFTTEGNNPFTVNLNKPKSRLGSKGTITSIDQYHTIVPGDKIQVELYMTDGFDNSGNLIGNISTFYIVP
jgi:hypothetical protein